MAVDKTLINCLMSHSSESMLWSMKSTFLPEQLGMVLAVEISLTTFRLIGSKVIQILNQEKYRSIFQVNIDILDTSCDHWICKDLNFKDLC